MAITPASANALSGIQRGMEGLQRSASEIASAARMNGAPERGLAEPLVEQIRSAAQVEASVQVLRTENDLLGSLLNVKV